MLRGSRAGVLLLSAGVLMTSACATSSRDASAARGAHGDRHLAILCYHDISAAPNAPLLTVSPEFLRTQIRECRKAGWTFITLDEVIAHREHPEMLPRRALVMTFDDGYKSFRKIALPILRDEHVPATLAVITGFVGQPPPDMAPLMSWDELNEVAADPLVTLASHTHALHRYESSNPYRDSNPAIATRRYILAEARYENREQYRGRVRADLDTARRVFNARLHRNPHVLVWPYGAQNEMARGIAALEGFPITLSLGDEVGAQDLRLGCLPRKEIIGNARSVLPNGRFFDAWFEELMSCTGEPGALERHLKRNRLRLEVHEPAVQPEERSTENDIADEPRRHISVVAEHLGEGGIGVVQRVHEADAEVPGVTASEHRGVRRQGPGRRGDGPVEEYAPPGNAGQIRRRRAVITVQIHAGGPLGVEHDHQHVGGFTGGNRRQAGHSQAFGHPRNDGDQQPNGQHRGGHQRSGPANVPQKPGSMAGGRRPESRGQTGCQQKCGRDRQTPSHQDQA